MGNSSFKQVELRITISKGDTTEEQLFDFNSPKHLYASASLAFPSYIAYDNGQIVYITEPNNQTRVQHVIKIDNKNLQQITVSKIIRRKHFVDDYNIWKVLGEGEQMELEPGDLVKIGKTRLSFKELVKGSEFGRNPTMNISDKQQTQKMDFSRNVDLEAKAGQNQCRICFDNTETADNPLVSLCKCSGSVKYSHFECLKDWVLNCVKKDRSPNCVFYSYEEPNCCELCKQPLQNQFKHEGQKFKLYQFEKVQPPYAVFQNREYDQQTGKTRISVYTISVPENSEVSIGRYHMSQVILHDISISRNHCTLTYKNGGLYIHDRNSKFGTLVSPMRGFEFNSKLGLKLQYQSKLIEIKEENALECCCCAQNSSYFVQFGKEVIEETP